MSLTKPNPGMTLPPGGTNGQVLSLSNGNLAWSNPPAGSQPVFHRRIEVGEVYNTTAINTFLSLNGAGPATSFCGYSISNRRIEFYAAGRYRIQLQGILKMNYSKSLVNYNYFFALVTNSLTLRQFYSAYNGINLVDYVNNLQLTAYANPSAYDLILNTGAHASNGTASFDGRFNYDNSLDITSGGYLALENVHNGNTGTAIGSHGIRFVGSVTITPNPL
jgi:hypothetical protein